ncbi:hypothetical protein RCCGEPOP_36348, partial [Rhizobium sp. Pop5]
MVNRTFSTFIERYIDEILLAPSPAQPKSIFKFHRISAEFRGVGGPPKSFYSDRKQIMDREYAMIMVG